ncbi:hypothetical protein EV200_10861 [Pedobacter psychrotolerans]|uniref:DUF4397 domain-containing protein n=1 Tax=Pedobacter psychrotolerans TaxID=1843235 RepID=A0A4R2H4Q2_9SPHI|nr:DUF4397 domain-containing protein [Pedobacter psychrotolerans]TCO20621.1 hypothetical protein EV200_10861 [Pedobacter psychrotolerans]GGE66865.1 hypothetical protein GCM10011413_36790 [Pedobacter psychrotolerans]
MATICISACIKNDNFIKGDAKIRIFQASVLDTTQNFFLNGRQLGSSTTYGTNSSYIVEPGDSSYKISSRILTSTSDLASLDNQRLVIGKNYSVFLTKASASAPSSLLFMEDDVKIGTDSTKLIFLNLGYTLGSPVLVTDTGKAFSPFNMAYGEKFTRKIKLNKSTKISFTITSITPTNPKPVVAVLDSPTLLNGKVYTVLIDGSKVGDLQTRLVTGN